MSTPNPASIHIEQRTDNETYGPYWIVVDWDGQDLPSTGHKDRVIVEQYLKVRRGTVKAMITRRRNKAAK